MKLKDEQGMTKKDIPTSFFEMLNIRLPKGKFWQKSIYKLAVNKIRMEMQKELLTESPERCFYKKKSFQMELAMLMIVTQETQ